MPKTTIKEVLEDLLWGEYDSEREKIEESITEIRQILKECEPESPSATSQYEYTANIEKILNLTDSLPLNEEKRLG